MLEFDTPDNSIILVIQYVNYTY